MIELAGWGGGPGYSYSANLKGPMVVDADPVLGLIVARCLGPVEAPEWVVKALGHNGRQGYKTEHGQQKLTTIYELPAGTEIRFGSNHVRMMV